MNKLPSAVAIRARVICKAMSSAMGSRSVLCGESALRWSGLQQFHGVKVVATLAAEVKTMRRLRWRSCAAARASDRKRVRLDSSARWRGWIT